MKKNLFLAIIVAAMLFCLFAVGVSAGDIDYSDAPVRTKYQANEDDIVEFDDGFKCSVSYVFKDTNKVDRSWNSKATFPNYFDFEYINSKTGKGYTFDNVVGFDIPQGITSVGLYAGKELTTLKWISFPDSVVEFGNAIFENAKGLERCTMEHNENSPVTVFPAYMFFGCSSLKAFSMPDCFKTFNDIAHFSGCTNLEAVYLSKNLTELRSTGGGQRTSLFDDNYKLYFVNEPFTYDNIPEKPRVYYFPANISFMSNDCIFRECRNLNDVLVFGEKVTEAPNMYLFQGGPANTIVFLGDMTTVATQYWGSTKTVLFANENDKSLSDITFSGGKKAIFCHAEADASHVMEKEIYVEAGCEVDAGMATYCFCGYEISKEAIEGTAYPHDYDYLTNNKAILLSIEYASYSKNGTKKISCANCGEAKDFDAPALFVTLGYSVEEGVSYSMILGFVANWSAISEYEDFAKITISYGVFAASQNKLGANDIFDTNGVAFADAIVSNLSNAQHQLFQLKIKGFSSEQLDTKLAIGAFVRVDDGSTVAFTYIQSSEAKNGEKYAFTSYNDAINSTK